MKTTSSVRENFTAKAIAPSYAITVAMVGLLLLAVPVPAGAMIYNFTEIASNQGQSTKYYYSDHQPAINRFGIVAFHAAIDGNQQGIFVGNSAMVKEIVDTNGLLSDLSTPSINDGGDVAFRGKHIDNVVFRFNAADSTFTTIADETSMFYSFHHYVSINNSGVVAFQGSLDSGGSAVAHGKGGPLSLVDPPPSITVQNFGPPVINTANPLVEIAFRATYDGGSSMIRGGALPSIFLASTGGPFYQWTSKPSINNDGEALFSAETDSHIKGVYASDGIAYTPVAHSSGTPFNAFYAVAHSTTGSAFEASLDAGGYGVFTGPSPGADKVIMKEQILQGFPSTVQNVHIGPEALNDSGQLAMQVMFYDGSYRIIRADPFGELMAVPEGFDAAAAMRTDQRASLGREIIAPPDRAVLEFEYRFASTTGQLVVKLGGAAIADISAPRTLTHDFETISIPVDVLSMFPDRPAALNLEFALEGAGQLSGVLIDDITFPGLINGDFGTGDLSGWDVDEPFGSAVGVAVPARVPEPSTLVMCIVGLIFAGRLISPRRR